MNFYQFFIGNIHCSSCISSIEKHLNKSKELGIKDFSLNLIDKTLITNTDTKATTIINCLKKIGYNAELMEFDNSIKKQNEKERKNYLYYRNHSFFAIFLGSFLMLQDMFHKWTDIQWQFSETEKKIYWIIIALASLFVMLKSGKHFYVSAWQKIKHLQTNMDSLIVLSTLSAWVYSSIVILFYDFFPIGARGFYFEASLMIIGLVNLGNAMEIKTKQKTFNVLENLLNIQPKLARVILAKIEKQIPIEKVKKGDIIRILEGEKIPLDAEIIEGSCSVDESAFSGEFIPKFKEKGMKVIGGSINLEGGFLAKVVNTHQNSMLSQIINIVQKAKNSKPPIAKLTDKISSIFVPIILTISLATAIFWYFFAPEDNLLFAFITGVCVLVIACPCVLGLATPLSVMAGIFLSAKNGVLIKSAEILQILTKTKVLVLDKTGTITKGKPYIVKFKNFSQKSDKEILQISLSLEQHSKHPFANAFFQLAKTKKLNTKNLFSLKNFQSIIGSGIKAEIKKENFFLGSKKWLKKLNFNFPNNEKNYYSTVFLASETSKKIIAGFYITDKIKETSILAINKILAKNIRIIIASGDNQENVFLVAKQCNINEAKGDLSPKAKKDLILELQQKGKKVIFVGDGTNDAPSLVQADVGIAMASGSDIATENADAILMENSLEKIQQTMKLAKKVSHNIYQNLFFAFFYNLICIPIAAGVIYPWTGILLNPVFAALAMSLSSLTVVLNSVRLYSNRLQV